MVLIRYSVSKFRQVTGFLLGAALGVSLTAWLPRSSSPVKGAVLRQKKGCNQYHNRLTGVSNSSTTMDQMSRSSKTLVFIGVMTTADYLSTRAVAVNRTWAKTVPGEVIFFSSESSEVPAEWNLPVVSLHGVDDSYPPQKKAFMMLKYMHDNLIDKYEWFMRADDDAYIKGDRLESFLRSVNGTGRRFIGQPGLGEGNELLHLNKGENFCMGGPGVILSRETLRSIAPHIRYCLKNLWTTHEDVEIGRCVHKFAGLGCTWSYEMKNLFYFDFNKDLAFTGNLHNSEVWDAITLHPIKRTPHMYRLHAYIDSQNMAQKRLQILTYHREIHQMKNLLHDVTRISGAFDQKVNNLGLHPGLIKFVTDSFKDVIPWKFSSNNLYLHNMDSPRKGITKPLQAAVTEVVLQTMQLINSNSHREGRTIELKKMMYGYSRLTPSYGVDYIFNLLLVNKIHDQSSRPQSVRRNAYLTQSFGKVELIEDELLMERREMHMPGGRYFPINSSASVGFIHRSTFHQKFKEMIHFIVPLAGRLETFKRFLKNFENNHIGEEERVTLSVVLFKSPDDQSKEIENNLLKFKRHYPGHDIRFLHGEGDFKRGLALNIGASQYPASALLFFVDVDMYVSKGFLSRCRQNTRLGSQIYFPIDFRQYNPDFASSLQKNLSTQLVFSKETGFFMGYGYGQVCLYNADLQQVGGMDSSIVGWGFEDVDLYQKFASSNITVFRAPDPGLIHIYHPMECDERLEAKRYQMCIGSKSNGYGSNLQLVKQLQNVMGRDGVDRKELKEL